MWHGAIDKGPHVQLGRKNKPINVQITTRDASAGGRKKETKRNGSSMLLEEQPIPLEKREQGVVMSFVGQEVVLLFDLSNFSSQSWMRWGRVALHRLFHPLTRAVSTDFFEALVWRVLNSLSAYFFSQIIFKISKRPMYTRWIVLGAIFEPLPGKIVVTGSIVQLRQKFAFCD